VMVAMAAGPSTETYTNGGLTARPVGIQLRGAGGGSYVVMVPQTSVMVMKL